VIYNYLVGNNDAHSKNFSLIYHAAGIRLAPLYDVVSTIYYPELSQDIAMRIGSEYSSEKVTARNFEQLAEEAELGKPLVRARVRQMGERVVDALETMDLTNSDAEKVAALIRQRGSKRSEG
jgi:serine/threonine-protein kinase HipA